MLRGNIVDVIGNTPLVQLRLDSSAKGKVFAKLEMLNPFGMKDRVAKQIILEAKKNGVLKEGDPIIESSSGTMALGLASVGTYFGHPVHIVTDIRTDQMTVAKLKALGCKVDIVTEMTHLGWQSARLDRLGELLKENKGAFCPHQYENPDNPKAYEALAEEAVEELGHIDILVASVGSGGSLCGTAQALKKRNPNVYVVAVDAVGSVIFNQPDIPGRLQGGHGNSVVPKNVDLSIIDEIHWLNDEECFAANLELAAHEKIFAGNSSAVVYAVSRFLSKKCSKETNILTIFPDRGDRYYKTVYNEDYRQKKGITQLVLPEQPKKVLYGKTVTTWSYACLQKKNKSAVYVFEN
ncbi:cysteine synthase family protein [Bacillus thuringiensis]|uniref:cysteine synthase family protein n=1 Tax=Bacillus thuringiensis TaxID=1428 RepID=UPI000E54AB35|nr:cysteine synthase family protein [Bacillus thuringiensis]MDZ3952347.1 cysteine synthase family protein [Bacillus thuringiensis]RGP45182.1 pyridoxal-5'-phosphate-dependent protein [Bacillus thuringiensis]